MQTKYQAVRNDDRLFFVVLQTGHEDIFTNDLVEDHWMFWEDVGCDPELARTAQYDMHHVVMKALNAATRALVQEWRGLQYVCFVERNQTLTVNGELVELPSFRPLKK
jgi:hypothetical protein